MLAILTLCVILYPHSKGSKEKSITIMTSSNEAYGDIRQGREQEEIMDIARADQEAMYEIPSASSQPLPAIPPEEAKGKEEDIMYEVIPGEK